MELWLQIAIGIVIGTSIVWILKGLKDTIVLYNMLDHGYHVNPASMLKKAKNSMRSTLLGVGFGFVDISLYLFDTYFINYFS